MSISVIYRICTRVISVINFSCNFLDNLKPQKQLLSVSVLIYGV